ncbi:MAG: Acid sugar phosphatase [Hyphomicrobiaceae bacterium hypho_1]
MTHNISPVIAHAAPLLSHYDVLFCDIWGVVHNGVRAYQEGCEVLSRFRCGGGIVILVSNAPRRGNTVRQILEEKSVPDDIADAIVSSGDLAHSYACEQGFNQVYHIGPERDLDVFDDSDLGCVELEAAEAIFCTGLTRDTEETGENYRKFSHYAIERGLTFICANPDLVVDVGGRLFPCAGAIAKVYEDLGGDVYWAGKPFPVVYEFSQSIASKLRGVKVDKCRILAIGDALRTDIAGAVEFGIDSLFIGQGIHRNVVMPTGEFDVVALEKLFTGQPKATAIMKTLRW